VGPRPALTPAGCPRLPASGSPRPPPTGGPGEGVGNGHLLDRHVGLLELAGAGARRRWTATPTPGRAGSPGAPGDRAVPVPRRRVGDYPQIEQWAAWMNQNPALARPAVDGHRAAASSREPRAVTRRSDLGASASASPTSGRRRPTPIGPRREAPVALQRTRPRPAASPLRPTGSPTGDRLGPVQAGGAALVLLGVDLLRQLQGAPARPDVFSSAHTFGGFDGVDPVLGGPAGTTPTATACCSTPAPDMVFPRARTGSSAPFGQPPPQAVRGACRTTTTWCWPGGGPGRGRGPGPDHDPEGALGVRGPGPWRPDLGAHRHQLEQRPRRVGRRALPPGPDPRSGRPLHRPPSSRTASRAATPDAGA